MNVVAELPTKSSMNKRRLTFVFYLTTFYLFIEFFGGILTKSLALIADAGHMLTDAGGLGIALIALKLSEQKATLKHTFGYHRAEILAALTNALLLILISFYILSESIQRIVRPEKVITLPTFIIAIVGLIVNLIGVYALRPVRDNSLNMTGAYYEIVVDFCSSVGVVISAIIIALTHWYYIDPIISFVIGIGILPGAGIVIKESISILLEGVPSEINMRSVLKVLRKIPGVKDIHELHIWTLTSGLHALSVHIRASSSVSQNKLLQDIHNDIYSEFKIKYLTIQIEDDLFPDCAKGGKFFLSEKPLIGTMIANS